MLRLFFIALFAVAANAAGQKPNIVFILADDLGIDDLACYGRADHLTPHLDKLAAEGVRLITAYCAQPICSPTRAALMTGKTPARLHLTTYLPGRADAPSQMLLHPKIALQLPLEERTIAEMLKEGGYATACIGKWHLGDAGFGPEKQGFDVVFAGEATTTPSAEEGGKGEYGLTARAERFIEENKARPFFLHLAHNNPHVPLAARPELVAKHARAFNPIYAAMIETLDDSIGRLLAKLDQLGLREQTLVVFTSDNGGLHVLETPNTPATRNAPFRAGKGYLYEGGLRVPAIARWPGRITPGTVMADAMISTDWVPTLLEVAGLPIPKDLDGISLAGLFTRGEHLPGRALYWHFPHYTNQGSKPAGAVREGDWKCIEHYEDGRVELFNLADDKGETTDLSVREPKRAADLRGKLAAWRQSVGAQENTPNPRFDPALAKMIYDDMDTSRLAPSATVAELGEKLKTWRSLMNRALEPDAFNKAIGPVIILRAKDAEIHGTTLRYEPQPQKNTLGFWTRAADWASWKFDLAKAGFYEIEMLQGCSDGGSEVEVSIGERKLHMTVQSTGHFQNFIPVKIGTVMLPAGANALTVKPTLQRGAAIMDLRAVTLKPSVDASNKL